MNEFTYAFLLKSTYRTNTFLYHLSQIPFIRTMIPYNLYANSNIKTFMKCIAFIYEVFTLFIGKLIYLFSLLLLPVFFLEIDEPVILYFYHLLFFMTICGAILNTSLFESSTDKYYAVCLMRMNAKKLALSEFFYFQLRQLLGLIISMFILKTFIPFEMIDCFVVSLFVVSCKFIFCAITLKIDKFITDEKMGFVRLILCVFALGCAIGFLFLSIVINQKVLIISTCITTLLAFPSVIYIVKYNKYDRLYKKLLTPERIIFDDSELTESENKTYTEKIDNVEETSNLKGYAYLNDLFIKRHKKMLTKTTNYITYGILLVLFGLGCAIVFNQNIKEIFNTNLVQILPYSIFLMYMINRGESITKAMFINCDNSMLHYSFYRQPKAILEMFALRLKSLVIINLKPSLVLATGLVILYLLSGGSKNYLEYLIIFVSILCLSIFYSVHYLVLYYLLQPYNAQVEMKNPIYQAANGLTYFIAYVLMEPIGSSLFGIWVIGITISYILIALLLVYLLAPKTFRLK